MKRLVALTILSYLCITSLTWAACIQGNCVNGKGTYTWADGTKYVGEHKDGKRNGQGTVYWSNGSKYVGEWQYGKRTGQGTMTWANGDKYVGEFKDAKQHGQGTMTWATGYKYVGEFKDAKQHGQGTATHINGNIYVGEHKDGKRNGQGTYYWADGRVWEGLWQDGECPNCKTYAVNSYTRPSLLKSKFNNLSYLTRQSIQRTLGYLGLYKSSFDGLYGKRTEEALKAYNKKYFGNKGLSSDHNVENLLISVLNAKKPKQQSTNKIYKVSSGSGFYVSKEGHVVTNHHVIEGCREIKIFAKGKLINTDVIASDRQNDLALLKAKINPPFVFPISTDTPYGTQEVVVAGYPFGNSLSSSIKFTKGIVSSLSGLGNNYSEIQIDAAIQPGNSGGPIIDEYGNVLGVAVAKLDVVKIVEDYGTLPENVNFGIKASTLMSLLKSHEVPLVKESKAEIKPRDLGKNATDGTVFLTCWMTMAQIESYKKKKAMFEEFED